MIFLRNRRSKAQLRSSAFQVLVSLVAGIGLVLLVGLVFFREDKVKNLEHLYQSEIKLETSKPLVATLGADPPLATTTSVKTSNHNKNIKATDVPADETVHRVFLRDDATGNDIEYIWQMPIPKNKKTNPNVPDVVEGIFFVAHGCKHSATDWFPRPTKENDSSSSSSNTPDFWGLPEERAIVQMARERGLLVVAVSSLDRKQKCWKKSDGARVAKVLTKMVEHVRSNNSSSSTSTSKKWAFMKKSSSSSKMSQPVPIYGMGSSSGADMVGWILPTTLHSATSTTATRKKKKDPTLLELNGAIMQNKMPKSFYDKEIPAAYITLPNDGELATNLDAYVAHERKGRPTKRIHLSPYIIGPSYFHDRIPDTISISVSEQIYQQLRQAGLVIGKGILVEDPKVTRPQWAGLIAPLVAGIEDSLIPDASAIYEVLNVAYGHHQTTRDGVAEALDWLMMLHQKSSS